MSSSTSTAVWKACQRRLYSWLSSRCGLPLCVVGTLIAIISALQFGEVLIEWSKERYAVQFSIYADNIASRSYEAQLCPPLPIDIVYTWVNGSDPVLIKNLRDLKRKLARKPADNATTSANSTTHPSAISHSHCPFSHCVPWRALVIDAVNLTTPLTVLNVGTVFPALQQGVLSCKRVNGSKVHTSDVYVIRMNTEERVSSILRSGLLDRFGSPVGVACGYLSSDAELAGGVKMDGFYLAVSDGIRPLNSSKLFRKWMESHFGREVMEAEVKANRTAVVVYKGDESALLTPPFLFSGEAVTFHSAVLIWLPFTLPDSEDSAGLERPDVVSASRFQDNEELRYSLRSVERFAPWVRHVFIVTNGQIPSWLNLDSPRVTIVPHKDIFPNHTHLPTYSSPAIESHLHRIPALADHFIYLNDDVMFGDHVWPEDFYTHQRGQKVYLSWPVPNCAEGCPPSWIRDNYCDANCNNSVCDWDGGDCANASRPGPQSLHGSFSHSASDYCGSGCLDSWLGDRYCDSACRILDCGYDAGDCGIERWEELLGYNLTLSGGNFTLPLETAALYFNLSGVFVNGSVSSANHTHSTLVRTAVVSQKYKTLALTLFRNVPMQSVNFTLSGSSYDKIVSVNFTLYGDTATKVKSNTSLAPHQGLAVNFTDTSSQEFLQAVVAKLPAANKSINYWIEHRGAMEHPAPPPTLLPSYSITNLSLLPPNVSITLLRLDAELESGELTQRGYLTERASLLHHYPHLITLNTSFQFGGHIQGAGGGHPPDAGNHMELNRMQEGAWQKGAGLALSRRKLLEAEDRGKLDEIREQLSVLGWEESRRRFPWERLHVFSDTPTDSQDGQYVVGGHRSRNLMEETTDTFADSLRHVNRLYTRVYGHDTRKVPSHMPHFIQKQVMLALQDKFPHEFYITSSHQVRMTDDMQYAFSYFYFLMGEKIKFDPHDIFKELDTDNTGILSVRELRTLLAMISELPITIDDVHSLETMLKRCDANYTVPHPSVPPKEYSTLYDPNLPLVTLNFTQHCQALLGKLKGVVTTRRTYKFEEITDDVVAFKMINHNATEVVGMLDDIRKHKKKFICLNDNIDHSKEGAELAKLILVDFYESLFPHASSFEIPGQYRNRFLHLHELEDWLMFKERMHRMLYVVFLLVLLLSTASLFYGKLVQCKRKFMRTIFVSKRTPGSI